MYEKKGQVVVIENGQVLGFEKEDKDWKPLAKKKKDI